MGAEVILFAFGMYIGWALFLLNALLILSRRTRNYAVPVLILGVIWVVATRGENWGVPWYVWMPLSFATAAIPSACGAALIAILVAVFRRWHIAA
jgi:hypothetical protein